MTREELLPKKLLERIPPLNSNDGSQAAKIIIHAKYFIAIFTWLVAECEVQADDVLFYGFVENAADPQMSEWGYFTLKQLMEIKLHVGLGVERDLYFKECTFSEYIKGENTENA